jgi:hypothetical protein
MENRLPDRFWLVVDGRTRSTISDHEDITAANDAARAYAKEHIGAVTVVMEVHEAFISRATVERTFLQFPIRAEETSECPTST